MMTRTIWSLLVLTLAAVGSAAEPDLKKAEQAVADKLKELKAEGAKAMPIKDDSVGRALPEQTVFSLLFPLYPVARIPPEPLLSQNLLAVGADGKVKLIADPKALQALFTASAAPVKDEKTAKDVGLAWLHLTEVLNQDGYYKFKTIDEATKVSDEKAPRKVSVKAVVMEGGNGEIKVGLTFDANGKLTAAEEMVDLKPGPRPRCHATKLLDPDPVVRAIVEQDLLIMGRAAEGYLNEQRAKASPELQRAIDEIWKRIQAGERR